MEKWAREYVRRRAQHDSDFRTALEKGAPALAAAKAVRQLRADMDVTQRGLAELTGVPQPQIARIEKARGASLHSLYRLAFALGLEIELRFTPGEQADRSSEDSFDLPTDIARVHFGNDDSFAAGRRVTLDRPVLRVEPGGRLDRPA